MNLRVFQAGDGQDGELSFEGFLDETCRLPEHVHLPPGVLYLNLEGLTGMNSLGSRKWAIWLKAKTKAPGGAALIRCLPAVVAQINALSGVTPKHVRIQSVFAPFACVGCGRTSNILLDRGIDFDAAGLKNARRACGACGQPLELDDVNESYFRFARAGA